MNIKKNKLLKHEKICIKSEVDQILFKLAHFDLYQSLNRLPI